MHYCLKNVLTKLLYYLAFLPALSYFLLKILIVLFSFHENEGLKNNPVELNKKRKLQEGESDLPIPKHKCWDRSFVSEPIFVLEKEPEVESTFKNIITGKTEAASMSCESEPESGRDSNSFGGDSDSATSTHGEAKIQVEYVKTNFDRPSTSSVNCDSNSFKHANYSSGFRKGKLAFLSGEHPKHHDGLQAFENLEEHLVDLCDQVDYTSSGDMETTALNCLQIEELDVEDILYSNGVNPANMYVLSSGRWTVSQGNLGINILEAVYM